MSFRKAYATMESTDSSRVYKLARRYLYTNCSFCRPHRGDNSKHNIIKSWKRFRKTRYKQRREEFEYA